MSNYVKIGIESTFGTHVSTTGINVGSVSDDIDRSIMVEENIDNYIADAGYGGTLKISGTIEGNLKPKQFGPFLEACLGGNSSGSYTLGIPKSLSLDIGEELFNQETQYCGVGISKISMKFAAKDFVTYSIDWFAKNYTIAAYSAPSITAEDPGVFYNASVKFGDTECKEIKEISLDIDRKLDDDNFVLGDYTIHRLARTGVTEISGSITFAESAFDEYRRAITGSTTGTAVDANNTLGSVAMVITVTNMSGSTTMTITCPLALYGKGGRKIDKVSEVEKTVDFKVVGTGFVIAVSA